MDSARETRANAEGQAPTPRASDLPGQRESMRRNFLRANTALAIILAGVLGLALAAVLASLWATRHKRLAEQAHDTARTELWRTYLSKSRAARLGSALDRRQESMRAVTNAAAIRSSDELRHEAIATLALTDFVLEHSWPLSEEATAQAFDQALQRYAVGWANGDIVVRRVSDNQVVQWLRQANGEVPAAQGSPHGLEFSPDGERLAARYQGSGAVVWDLTTAKAVFRHGVDEPRQLLSRPRFTSDGRFLVCMTRVPPEGVAVFDLVTGQSVAHFPFKAGMHAAPRPGTTMFSVNTETNTVLVLDWRTGQTIMSFSFPAPILRMAWSLDGKHLALGGNTVDVHLWDVETGQKRILTGHTADVRHLTFDPGGERLASASWDATSRIWETRTGRLLGVTDRGFAEQFGKDGRLALSRFKGSVEVWSMRPSQVHRTYVGPESEEASTWAMDLSPDGRWLASIIMDKGLVIWDLVGGAAPAWFEMPGVRLPCFHPTRPELYVTCPRKWAVRRLAFDTRVDALAPRAQPERADSLALPKDFIPYRVALSRNGQRIALTSFFEGRTLVTDLPAPEKIVWLKDLRHVSVDNPGATATGGGTLALSSDGRWAACGSAHPVSTKVWNAQSGEPVATLSSESAVVEFSPDDRWLVAGSRSHYQLFRAGDWQELWRVAREGALLTTGPCAFSPDGRQLAVTKQPQRASILDAGTGRELAQLVAPRPATIRAIRWSPDGQRLVIGTAENLVQVWELDALRGGLASLGLNWDGATAVASGSPSRVAGQASAGSLTRAASQGGIVAALVLGLLTAAVVTFVALLALRRHRQLIKDFARTEAKVDQRERELDLEREVSRLKSSFVSMVSHEFRTPLAVITASAGNLQRYSSRLPEEQRALLVGDIVTSSTRMRDLIEEVLLLGKGESGKMQCQPALVEISALCRRAISDVSATRSNRCPIEFTADSLNGEARLDEKLTGIVLTNLLSNAMKYSPAGAPVRLSLRREARDIVFEVRDQGIGIPEPDQKELFKSFHRGRNVGSVPGTGLGLTIVKRCVDLHGGQISFVSAEKQGTTFTVRLPAF